MVTPTPAATATPGCGDRIIAGFEQCDDGNRVTGDGCDGSCNLEICGNGRLQFGEACDDGNLVDGDGCSSTCTWERCGDGAQSASEECDDGNFDGGDGCDPQCHREICGNARVQYPEECEPGVPLQPVPTPEPDSSGQVALLCQPTPTPIPPGNNPIPVPTSPPPYCKSDCTLLVCGDYKTETPEECDDGNTANGDGCSASCVREYCGDGHVQAALGEQCDPNDPASADGCSSDCKSQDCSDIIPDVDGNGMMDLLDLLAIANYEQGVIDPPGASPDVNGDGLVQRYGADGAAVENWLAANPYSPCHSCYAARRLEYGGPLSSTGEPCLSEDDALLAPPLQASEIRSFIATHPSSVCVCGEEPFNTESVCKLKNPDGSTCADPAGGNSGANGASGNPPAATACSDTTTETKGRDILRKHCASCHSNFQGAGPKNILDLAELESDGWVVSGDSGGSGIWTSVVSNAMPKSPNPKLTQEEKDTLRDWIDGGFNAPNNSRTLLTEVDVWKAIYFHLKSLAPHERYYQRYFQTSYTSGTSECGANREMAAVSKVLNSLHWNYQIVTPKSVDAAAVQGEAAAADQAKFSEIGKTLYSVDISQLYGQRRPTSRTAWYGWNLIEGAYDEKGLQDAVRYGQNDPWIAVKGGQIRLSEMINWIYTVTRSRVPVVKAPWFVFRTPQTDLYYDLVGIRDKSQIQKVLGVNVYNGSHRLDYDYQYDRAARSGTLRSNVVIGNQNRLLDRLCSYFGAYWESYDVKASTGDQNLPTNPLGPNTYNWGWGWGWSTTAPRRSVPTWYASLYDYKFNHNGGEIIFNLPNGMQGYFLVNDKDGIIPEAPLDLVIDTKGTVKRGATSPLVNAISCMVCHSDGMIKYAPDALAAIKATTEYASDAYLRNKVDGLYKSEATIKGLLDGDKARFVSALTSALKPYMEVKGEPMPEPIQEVTQTFQNDVWPPEFAAAVGVSEATLLGWINRDTLLCAVLKNYTLTPAKPISRLEFTANGIALTRATGFAGGVLWPDGRIAACR